MKKSRKTDTSSANDLFLHLGGDPVLDFCNTLVFHGDIKEDRLLPVEDAENFWLSFFENRSKFSRRQLDDLLELRAELRKLFKAIVRNRCEGDCFDEINRYLRKHSFVFELGQSGDAVRSSVTPVKGDPVGPLIVALHRFLGELDLPRLKKCNNPNCSHFFYDRSKNNLRVWCSMKTCGNIMKVRAFYQRKKDADSDDT